LKYILSNKKENIMQKVIGVTELQRRFRSVFDEVTHDSIPYVLTRGSRPEAALIPYETFLQLMELQEDALLAEFDRLAGKITEQNAAFTEAEIEADVATAVAESRGDTSSH
jgi:prevent-host-death family protein